MKGKGRGGGKEKGGNGRGQDPKYFSLHRESKKQDTKLLAITSLSIIRFSKFFSLADSVVNLQQIRV